MPRGIPNKKKLDTPPADVAPAASQIAAPQPPSPAVLSLQSQVVDLVAERTAARAKLTEAHTAYLMAQAAFQAAQAGLQGIEQETQYRIGLIAQLENRAPMAPVLQMPQMQSMAGISVEPAPQQRPQNYGNADDMVSRAHASRDPNSLTGAMI